MIEFKNIDKKLGKNLVLSNLYLKIKNKTVFGLIGVNGAGKSTLLRCLAGIYKVNNGEVLVDDVNVYENVELKKRMFLISDDSYYPLNATILSLKELYKTFYEFNEEKFNYYLNYLKLDPNKTINNFSKGMKRQVFIMFALSLKLDILILDEAFDGLDPFVRLMFKKEIIEKVDHEEMIVIIASHNLRELEDVCDTFCILEDKRILTSGDLEQSKSNIIKIQVAFENEESVNNLNDMDIINKTKVGKVHTIVCKGNVDEIEKQIKQFNPLILDILPISFEELFMYELESKESKHE